MKVCVGSASSVTALLMFSWLAPAVAEPAKNKWLAQAQCKAKALRPFGSYQIVEINI
jgi:hypothetical protein